MTRKWVTRDDPGYGAGCGSEEFETLGERDGDRIAAGTVPFYGCGTGTLDWVQDNIYTSPKGQILGTILISNSGSLLYGPPKSR